MSARFCLGVRLDNAASPVCRMQIPQRTAQEPRRRTTRTHTHARTGDVDAVAAEDVEGIHREVLAREVEEAHIEVDSELLGKEVGQWWETSQK